MNNCEGSLIAIEGIDGAGTTTLVNNLKEKYKDREDVLFTKEPSDRYYGKQIREKLSDGSEPRAADFFAFLADRCDHCCQVIKPALEDGKLVITDRYALSTYAYQSKVLDNQLDIIDPMKYIDEMTYHFTIEPDAYIYLNIGPVDALDRINPKDRYEKREILKEAKKIYDYCAEEKENVYTIPALWEEGNIAEEVEMVIDGVTNNRV
jgi:dTMP kinase